MTPEVQAEYDQALMAVTVRNGYLMDTRQTRFHNYDWKLTGHPRECPTTAQKVNEDVWYEFAGTFASTNDQRKHGICATGVSCACGALKDRTIRWEASVSEIMEIVFEEAFNARSAT